MSQTVNWTISIIVVALAIVGVVSTTGDEANKESSTQVNIGAMLPLSGEGAAYGESIQRGVQLAASESDLSVNFANAEGTSESGLSAYRQLTSQGVNVIIGPVFSTVGQAVGPLAKTKGTILLSPTISSQGVTGIGSSVFSLYPPSGAEGAEIARYALSESEEAHYGIINSQEDVHIGVAEAIKGELKSNNANVQFQETISPNTKDFRTVITKVKNQHDADRVFVIGKKTFVSNFIVQAKELGYSPNFYSYAEMYDEGLLDKYGDDLNGLTLTAPYFDVESNDAGIADFRTAFEAEYDEELDVWAAYGYDAVKTIERAKERCGSCSLSELADTIKSLQFEGVTGPIEFNENGHAEREFRIFQIQNQRFIEVSLSIRSG